MKQTRQMNHAERDCTPHELWGGVDKFAAWLEKSGYATYDPYDVWGTSYGKLARRLYYEKHLVGAMMTAPLLLMEILAPSLRSTLVKKDRYPTADAQLALAFLNLYEASLDRNPPEGGEKTAERWLTKTKKLADE